MSRRGNNEGSIYKRSDGRWAGVVHLGYERGVRRRRSIYGRSRSDVARKLSEAVNAHGVGLPVPDERLTVGQFLESWLAYSAKHEVRASTFRGYESKLRNHLIPSLGRVRLAKLTTQHVQVFMNERMKSGLSAQTVRHLRAILRAALNDAMKGELVTRNAAALVDGPRVEQEEIQPIAPNEARHLLQAVRGDRLGPLFTVCLALGLRQGEALALTWNRIDLDENTLTVSATLDRDNGVFRLVEPKTKRSRRTLAISEVAADALRVHRLRQAEERLRAGFCMAGRVWTGVHDASGRTTARQQRDTTIQTGS